jgi:hypothetical protein
MASNSAAVQARILPILTPDRRFCGQAVRCSEPEFKTAGDCGSDVFLNSVTGNVDISD